MGILKRIMKVRHKRSDESVQALDEDSSLSADLAANQDAVDPSDTPLMNVLIEPDSSETKAQSLLKARSIEGPVFVIGRRCGFVSQAPEDVDFTIRQVEPYTVSKRHCSIERFADHVIVRDLGGKYGFLVNGQRIGGRADTPKSIKLIKGGYDLVLGPRVSTIRFKLIID